jgi:hypothetical protein
MRPFPESMDSPGFTRGRFAGIGGVMDFETNSSGIGIDLFASDAEMDWQTKF